MKSCQPALGPDWRRPNEVAPSIWPGREPKRTAAERPSSFSAFESEKPRCLGDCVAGPQSVILDALIGDATLFIRADEVARSWRIVDRLLAYWHPDARSDPALPRRDLGPQGSYAAHRERRPPLAQPVTPCERTALPIPVCAPGHAAKLPAYKLADTYE